MTGEQVFGDAELIDATSDALAADLGVDGPDIPAVKWINSAKCSDSLDNATGTGIALDSLGYIYITGDMSATATFGTKQLKSLGATDMFVAKLDHYGKWMWATGGVSSYAEATGIDVDSVGNSHVTGYFQGVATFGSTTLSSSGRQLFVAKLDSAGKWLWAVSTDGIGYEYHIGVDGMGNSYITGTMKSGVFGATSIGAKGKDDLFVAKLNSAGKWLWAVSAGSSNTGGGDAIAVDSKGNSYVTGQFGSTASFGATTLTAIGSYNALVAKLSSDGKWLWAKSSRDNQRTKGIAVDSKGNCFVSGDFKNSASFGTHLITSAGESDVFVAKIDAKGKWVWARSKGTGTQDFGTRVAVDKTGNAYVTGEFNSIYSGSITLPRAGSVFVAKIDTAGVWKGITTSNGSYWSIGTDIAVDFYGNTYTTGSFYGSLKTGSMDTIYSGGYFDLFVTRW